MNAPSNASTSGLEVVAYLEVSNAGMGRRACLHQRKDTPTMLRRWSSEPLVTAASAQAEREARLAAEARADRLAKGLKDAEESARRYARCYEPSSDGRNTFLMLADHIHALQQETQP